MKVVFFFFQGLPAAFASYLAPEQFRGGGCAHGSLRSPRQSGAALYSEISLLGCLRSVAPWWTCGMCPVPMPKKGCGELLSPPDCTLAPGTLWDVAVLTAAWNMKQVAHMIRKSVHPFFNSFTAFGSSVEELVSLSCSVWWKHSALPLVALGSSLSAAGWNMLVLWQTPS